MLLLLLAFCLLLAIVLLARLPAPPADLPTLSNPARSHAMEPAVEQPSLAQLTVAAVS